MDTLINIYRTDINPAAAVQPGFKGAMLLTDRKNNKAISITYWENEDDWKAGETSGYYQQQIIKALPTFSSSSTRDVYEVNFMK